MISGSFNIAFLAVSRFTSYRIGRPTFVCCLSPQAIVSHSESTPLFLFSDSSGAGFCSVKKSSNRESMSKTPQPQMTFAWPSDNHLGNGFLLRNLTVKPHHLELLTSFHNSFTGSMCGLMLWHWLMHKIPTENILQDRLDTTFY